ncbi:MAG: hypothetical protein PHS79_03355 [Patescibacteria group bacterium]|nr:hypothetical protein [Patescibacteria group bacterium]
MPLKNNLNDFNNCWLGYDLPYSLIEGQPSVQALRKAGIEKRVKTPEHHVTVAYFADINLYELSEALKQTARKYGKKIEYSKFDFDGYGVIDHEKGRYVYFSPDPDSAAEAFYLKDFFARSPLYTKEKNCEDLHVSIGGPDPFSSEKPRQWPLNNPFSCEARLVFVGNDGKTFHKYVWRDEDQEFEEIPADLPFVVKGIQSPLSREMSSPTRQRDQLSNNPTSPASSTGSRDDKKNVGRLVRGTTNGSKPVTPISIHTVAMFPKIQADTASAYYILKNFGKNFFPGVAQAKVVFWTALPEDKTAQQLESEGFLTIDLGGIFDHHISNVESGKREECAASLIAQHLGVENDLTLKKLLTWAKRDDLQGKGTMSADPLDRAFGLSGIIMNANREYANDPQKSLDLITHIIDLHVHEERRRQIELPMEFEKLEQEGKVEVFSLRQGGAELEAMFVETDNVAMAGFLRAAKKIDLIIQRRTSGHTNIVTQQARSIDLRPLAAVLRLSEAEKKNIELDVDEATLMSSGRIKDIDEWYYDDAANSIQNGGVNPEGVKPTKLSRDEVVALVRDAIPLGTIGTLKRQKNS